MPIYVGQLSFIDALTYPVYSYQKGQFKPVLSPREGITDQFIKQYATEVSREIYIHYRDYEQMRESISEGLTQLSRSLSMGDSVKKTSRHAGLLTLQLGQLYDNPYDDQLLTSQFQSSKNLGQFLLTDKEIVHPLYQNVLKQGHDFVLAQPLLSSLLLLNFLQNVSMFSGKEIQSLFLASYFKDMGMSFVPQSRRNIDELEAADHKVLDLHAEQSVKLLRGRVPLPENYLTMIENHHFMNAKIAKLASHQEVKDGEFIYGIETTLLSAFDLLVAMTSDRPYRKADSIYRALELLKLTISKDYPKEYRSIVLFIRSFFKNMP